MKIERILYQITNMVSCMKKKLLIAAFLTIPFILIGLLIFLPFIKKEHVKAIEADSEIHTNKWFEDKVQSYDVILCDFGLKNSVYTFTYEKKLNSIVDYHIHFFDVERRSIFNQGFNVQYTGGTTLKNTTFPELVNMVKDDCSQFQESKGNYYDETINWSYSPYTPEPELTAGEMEQEEDRRRAEDLRSELWFMTDEQLEHVRRTYGVTEQSPDSQLLEWHKKGLEDGYFFR